MRAATPTVISLQSSTLGQAELIEPQLVNGSAGTLVEMASHGCEGIIDFGHREATYAYNKLPIYSGKTIKRT